MTQRFAFAAKSRHEYVANAEFHDLSSGQTAPAYEAQSGATLDNATLLDPNGWIRLRAAIDLVARSEILRNSGDILDTLVSALKSASILAIHGAITRIDNIDPHDGGHIVDYEKFFLSVYPYQWATSISINIHDNSINLADGRPLLDIYINKQDVEDWIEARSNPHLDHAQDPEVEQRSYERTYRLVTPGDDTFVFPKTRGGRPQKYDWTNAYLKLFVWRLYVKGDLGWDSNRADIGTMLRSVFTADGLENGPQESILKKHANLIWQELQRVKDA